MLDDSVELISRIESNCDVNSFVFKGIKVWPLIRIVLDSELQNASKQRKSSIIRRLTLSQLFRYALSAFLKSMSISFYLFQRKVAKNCNGIFFTQTSLYTSIAGCRGYFDRIADPFIESAKNLVVVQKVLFGQTKHARLHEPGHVILIDKSQNFKASDIENYSELELEIGKTSIEFQHFEEALNGALNDFYCAFEISKRLYQNCNKLSFIVSDCWYSYYHMGAIAAARQNNLKVIELQHGSQGGHPAYRDWGKVPVDGYEIMPNSIWCWDLNSAEQIDKWAKTSNGHSSVVTGYPWKEYRQSMKRQSGSFDYLKNTNEIHKPRLLVTLQGKTVSNNPIALAEEIIERLNGKHVEVTFKLHPNEISTKREITKVLNVCGDKVKVVSSESDLYYLLEKSTHHVTAYSSSCIDAYLQGVPTLLIGEDALSAYTYEISCGIFTWAQGVGIEIEQFIFGQKIPSSIAESYVKTSLDVFRPQIMNLI